jgi:hypothetical protein
MDCLTVKKRLPLLELTKNQLISYRKILLSNVKMSRMARFFAVMSHFAASSIDQINK